MFGVIADIFIFNLQSGEIYLDGRVARSHKETLDRLEELGFKVIEERSVLSSAEDIEDYILEL